jgi:hypothetical protein
LPDKPERRVDGSGLSGPATGRATTLRRFDTTTNGLIRACRDLTEPLRKADDGSRTRDLELGKLALYQLSYVRRVAKSRSSAALRFAP